MHEVSEWLKELIIPPTRTPAKLGTLDDYLIFNTVIGRYVQSGYGGITGVLDQNHLPGNPRDSRSGALSQRVSIRQVRNLRSWGNFRLGQLLV